MAGALIIYADPATAAKLECRARICALQSGPEAVAWDFAAMNSPPTHAPANNRRRQNPLHAATAAAAPQRACVLLLLAMACVLWPASLPAQVENGTPAAEPEITLEVIEARRKQVEEAKDLDEAARTRTLELYRQAADALKRAKDLAAKTVELEKQTASVEQRLAETKADLVSIKSRPEPEIPASAQLAALEQEQAKRQAELDALRKSLADRDAESNRRAGRRREIRAALASAPERAAELKTQEAAPPPPDEPPAVTLARRTELIARRQAIEREIPALEKELALYDAEEVVDLVRLQRDLLTQQVAAADQHIKKLNEVVNQRRRDAAADAVRQARVQAQMANPLLKSYAEFNTQLAEEAQQLTPRLEQAGRELKAQQEELESLQRRFAQTREKVESVGLTGPIGLLLRRQRSDLPDRQYYRRRIDERRDEIDQIQFKLFELEEARSDLANLEPLVQQVLAKASLDQTEQEESELKEAARDVFESQRNYLDVSRRNHSAFFDTLVELDITERQIISEADNYARFIDERVLWIRSSKWLSVQELKRDRSLAELIGLENWRHMIERLWADVRANPIPMASAWLLFGGLAFYRGRFRRELKEIGAQAQRGTFSRFAPTMRAVLLTGILATFGPALVAYLAWRLEIASDQQDFARSLAEGLWTVAATYYPLEFIRYSFRSDGLAEAHFGWSPQMTRLLRRKLRWLMLLGLPLLLVIVTLAYDDADQGRDALERIGFILAMVLLAVFVRGILHPTAGLFGLVVNYQRGGWFDRLKTLWRTLGGLLPLTVAVLAFVGYYYTARQLAWRMEQTVWLLVAAVYLRALLMRLLLIHRRRLSMRQARERRAAAEERSTAAEGAAPGTISTEETKGADLAVLSSQTQRLLNVALATVAVVGFWWIWIDMLPALNFLDRWPLWTTMVQVSETVTSPTGETTIRVGEKPEAVTMAHLAAALIIAVITVIAARNIPGVLEMSLLQRLPLDPAARYATTTLAMYLIVLLGTVLAFGTIGVSWSKIQWLATALTFGLAFGLQEIFANFVAGLIILFERPIRVGDIVTVADVSGVVSRIRIRATTIVNWDRQELIVPNKEFITGRLLNWTLTDSTNRIVLEVGVAYGSDVALARSLLLQCADEHPKILKDPPPTATFDAFGDSALNFTLRVYLGEVPDRLPVINDLHAAVDQKFREAGIEIAFPQRDIHIRSGAELLAGDSSNGAPASANKHEAELTHVSKKP